MGWGEPQTGLATGWCTRRGGGRAGYYGVKYPYKKYDQVVVPDFNVGAMENIAAVTFNENVVQRDGRDRDEERRLAETIAHEMAHMWFGNLVTMRW